MEGLQILQQNDQILYPKMYLLIMYLKNDYKTEFTVISGQGQVSAWWLLPGCLQLNVSFVVEDNIGACSNFTMD